MTLFRVAQVGPPSRVYQAKEIPMTSTPETKTMTAGILHERLSLISTHWSLLSRAHDGEGREVRTAQHELLDRYGGAVWRYLLGAVRDGNVADDLFQDFACKFLRGGLRGANPDRGRFRDFLKGVLAHLAADYYRGRHRAAFSLDEEFAEPAQDAEPFADQDAAFRESWREELLARAWHALAGAEEATGQPLHTVLQFRAENPALHSPEMADRLSVLLGRPLTAVGVRQLLHRARERFAELLLEETRASLEGAAGGQIEEELAELNLLKYCRDALRRRGG